MLGCFRTRVSSSAPNPDGSLIPTLRGARAKWIESTSPMPSGRIRVKPAELQERGYSAPHNQLVPLSALHAFCSNLNLLWKFLPNFAWLAHCIVQYNVRPRPVKASQICITRSNLTALSCTNKKDAQRARRLPCHQLHPREYSKGG